MTKYTLLRETLPASRTVLDEEKPMTTSTLSTPARSDLLARSGSRVAAPQRPFLRHGAALSTGALLWALGMALFGVNQTDPTQLLLFGAMAGAFQVGLLALLRVQWRTQALGPGRLARAVLRAESVAVVLAMGSTAADAFGVSDLDQPGWLLLDAFWPLSMLGMCLIGIRIAVHGRWTGATRFWPMVAESWAMVVIPTMAVLGEPAATVVAVLHLCVGYAVLGVLVARKEG